MIRKILALHLIILLILSGCAGTISTNSNQEENVASENSIVVTKQDQISLTQLIESLDQQDWYGAAESWKEIEYNNPELYSSLCVRYPKMQVALIGIDPDSDSFIYDVFFEKYPIHKVYANKEAKIADAMYYDYKMLVDLAVSEGFVERLNEDDINVTRELTKEEQLRVLDLHEMQTEIHLRETISDMYSELALGIGDTSEYDEEIYALEFAVNEIRIQKELTKILDFNTFTGDKTSNIILMAALRMQGIIYSQDQMLHAPQVYWPGRNMGDFSSYKDPLSQGYIKFQNTINLINPILLYRALQHPELKDVFDNEIAIASIMEIKRMIDNNEVTNIEVAFLAIEEKAAKRKKERTDEIEWKYYAGKDITLNWFDEFHPKRITNGQITLNGGFLDSNEFGEGNQAGDFTDVIIGRWGGVVQQAFKGYEHKWLFGSAYGNEGGTVTVTKGGVLDTRRPHLLPFDTYTVDTDKIVDRFRTEILVKSNPNLYIAMDKYIKSDIYLQGAVKLHSDSVSENEKNRIRYEIGIIFNENQYFDLAANVLKDVPAGTVLSGTTLVLSDELKSKYSGRTAGDLLDDIKGIGVFDLSSSTKKFWTDIGIYLINPAQWLVYGAIGRAGITVLSSFRTGRLILGAATRFGSNIYGFSWALERAGGNVIVSTVFRILGIVGEETFEELVGLIYPPLEPIAMIINGVDPWEAANPKLKLLGGAKFFGRTSIGGIDTDVYSMSKFDMLNLKAGEYDTDIGKVVLSWDEDAQVFYYDHPQTGNRIALGELGN
ncbi:MAG: hypothetical protein KKF44_06170, partial [Nanoarchaeota archaeon]|nr:hypothetical protein [Nanoarchaeota archaeon]